MPEKTKEYVIWSYGNGWRTPNCNWRLNDGEMVILNNLKSTGLITLTLNIITGQN